MSSTLAVKLVLVVLMAVGLGFSYGFASHRSQIFPYEIIRNLHRRLTEERGVMNVPMLAALELDSTRSANLAALGYLEGYDPAPTRSGVIIHDPELAFEGYNYYVSTHAPEAILMNMEGRVLHTWHKEFKEIFPTVKTEQPRSWRRARLLENGDLLAIFDYAGIFRLDKDSNVLWGVLNSAHHDLDIGPDGRIYVLTEQQTSDPDLRGGQSIREDFVEILTPDGEEVSRVSVLRAFLNSDYAEVFEQIPAGRDIFHTNTIEVLDGRLEERSSAFKAGNVLLSLRNIDVIAVIDLKAEKIVWAMSGMWKEQHQPTLLENGNILLFDNQGHYGFSKIVEFDPFAQMDYDHIYRDFDPLQQKVAWSYEGNASNGFVSRTYGSSARLPNGNTLVTQSRSGRAFEVTPDGVIVWEYLNPNTRGDHDELIAVMAELVRIDTSYTRAWLSATIQ